MVASWLCASMAALAAIFLGLRAQMLKPNLHAFPDAPTRVWAATLSLSIVLGAYTVAVVNGYQPSSGEGVILAALAIYSGTLWLNLYQQSRLEENRISDDQAEKHKADD